PAQTQGSRWSRIERMQRDHARARQHVAGTIATPARSSCHDDLEHAEMVPGRDLRDLASQGGHVRRGDAQSSATVEQALQMVVEKTNATLHQQRGFKQTVAVLQATIVGTYQLRWLSIDQHRECHRSP